MNVESYAKINIGLRIVGKRPDGYHELETLFQQISLSDQLYFRAADELTLETSNPLCPNDASNLIFRAAVLLRPFAQTLQKGCRIRLVKNIPMGAGLGGGSSNAATALKALNHLWNCGLSNSQLQQLATALGSDVPFFLLGGLALGKGRGEILTPLTQKPLYTGILVAPGFAVSTKTVYEKLNLTLTISGKISKFSAFGRAFPAFSMWKTLFRNDLESVVFREHPVLEALVRRFYSFGAFYAAMSGSGSSVFGLFENEEVAVQANKELQRFYRTFLFKPLYT